MPTLPLHLNRSPKPLQRRRPIQPALVKQWGRPSAQELHLWFQDVLCTILTLTDCRKGRLLRSWILTKSSQQLPWWSGLTDLGRCLFKRTHLRALRLSSRDSDQGLRVVRFSCLEWDGDGESSWHLGQEKVARQPQPWSSRLPQRCRRQILQPVCHHALCRNLSRSCLGLFRQCPTFVNLSQTRASGAFLVSSLVVMTLVQQCSMAWVKSWERLWHRKRASMKFGVELCQGWRKKRTELPSTQRLRRRCNAPACPQRICLQSLSPWVLAWVCA
mmetsp:Transcript_152184/g.283541  ORF Transcript_152184/g.283541 Transcript_152184/m.283541 type:complete len:273 (-) Transcript_152184:1142-1960(-)